MWRCLLNPEKDRSGFRIGIHKMVSKILQKELEPDPTTSNSKINSQAPEITDGHPAIYPCNILNYFSCPYGCKKGNKFKHDFKSNTEYLFELEKITSLVDTSLLKASSMTKSNESIYEVNMENNVMKEMENNVMKEIETLYNGKQTTTMKWNPIEKELPRIMDQSIIPIRNKENVLETLRDKEKLNFKARFINQRIYCIQRQNIKLLSKY